MSRNASSLYPSWLENALHSDKYVQIVFAELALREKRRDDIRDNLRKKLYPDLYQGRRSSKRFLNALTGVSNRSSGRTDERDARETELEEFFSVSIGAHPDNQEFNRYHCIEPYDRTRVVVPFSSSHPAVSSTTGLYSSARSNGHPGNEQLGRYLNASWVRELHGGKWWIASQAPLPGSTHTFLSLLLHPDVNPPSTINPINGVEESHADNSSRKPSRIRTIIQLTLSHEAGHVKAHPYFPTDIGTAHIIPASVDSHGSHHLSALKITLVSQEEVPEAGCVVSTLKLSEDQSLSSISTQKVEVGSEEVMFKHLLYRNWPDFGVPSPNDRHSLLKFIRLANKLNRDTSYLSPEVKDLTDDDPPMIVGCSAGVGRTGTFIALNSLLRVYSLINTVQSSNNTPNLTLQNPGSPLGPLSDKIREDLIAQEIDSLRDQRPRTVEKLDQIFLVYELLAEALRRDT